MKLLILITILIMGCQAKPTVEEVDEIDQELAAESELYEADEETADNEPADFDEGEPDTGIYKDGNGEWTAIEDGENIVDDEFAELAAADQAAEQEPGPAPAPASEPTGRFERLQMDCVVRSTPRGKRLHVLRKGRKLWVEVLDPGINWYKVSTMGGDAFMSGRCFK